MAKAIPTHSESSIFSIPLKLAVYCENCETISNSRPHRCGVWVASRFCALNLSSTAVPIRRHMQLIV